MLARAAAAAGLCVTSHQVVSIHRFTCARLASSLVLSKGRRSVVAYDTLTNQVQDVQGNPIAPLPDAWSETAPASATKPPSKRTRKSSKSARAEPDRGDQSSLSENSADAEAGASQAPRWPPLAQAVLADMDRFPECMLLTRVGGFYESYFHQAPQLASILGIKLANRRWGGRDVPMAGFPIFQLEKYLKTLVLDRGLLVAIGQEYRSNALHNEAVEITRRVHRVVSAGTLIDEKFLDPFSNNFILAVARISAPTPAEHHQPQPGSVSVSASGSGSERSFGFPGSISSVEVASTDESPSSSGSSYRPPSPDPLPIASASGGVSESAKSPYVYGLAWLDVGTADFSTTTCADLVSLRDEVARISPREIVLEPALFGSADPDASGPAQPWLGAQENGGAPLRVDRDGPLWEAIDMSNIHVSCYDVEGGGEGSEAIAAATCEGSWEARAEAHAVKVLLGYLRTRLLEHDAEIDALTTARPTRLQRQESMQIDAHTLAALEIKEGIREGGVKGSLLSVMRRTVTKGGTRLLLQWLTSPSTSLEVIRARHDLVELFVRRTFLREDVRSVLRLGAGDISRVLQRLITRRNNEQDLLEVRDFIQACDRIVSKLDEETEHESDPVVRETELAPLTALVDKFHRLTALGDRLGSAIDERVIENRLRKQEAMAESIESAVAAGGGASGDSVEAIENSSRSGQVAATTKRARAAAAKEASAEIDPLWGENFEHLIRPSTSKLLTSMTRSLEKLRRDARRLEAEFKAKYGDHITLRFVLGQGFVVHARSKAAHDPHRELHVAGKLRSTHTYYSERWTLLGGKVHQLIKEMKEVESLELEQLRQDALAQVSALRWNAKLLDQLDVLVSYAQSAHELNLVRPSVDASLDFDVQGGRHLSVEMGLLEHHHRSFTKNPLHLSRSSYLHLITGPNMGGKSTFLRQNATLAILAQAGSFVPADSAHLGIVDRVFSRVGAKDDLFRDRSTFMVEMMETSEILRRATERSLVIADEIGRGTTTEVGTAIAFAALHHLYATNRCRTLFATHFHELADMLGYRADQHQPQHGGLESSTGSSVEEASRFPAIGFFCTDVAESEGGTITYSHRIRPGVNRESHGLKVAKMAEMPQPALEVAASTLQWLQAKKERNLRSDSNRVETYTDLYATLDGVGHEADWGRVGDSAVKTE